MLEGITVVLTFRIENSYSVGHHLIGHMMVADDEVDTQTLCIGNLLDRLNTAIENNN